jgi:hypothetical protein
MNFAPYEAEPDGQVGAPHHYYQGLGLVFAVAVAESSFWLTVSVVTGFIGFFLCWRAELYPTTGMVLSLVGVVLASSVTPLDLSLHSLAVVVGGLVALDDWITHATGVWAPLEYVWRDVVYPRLPSSG